MNLPISTASSSPPAGASNLDIPRIGLKMSYEYQDESSNVCGHNCRTSGGRASTAELTDSSPNRFFRNVKMALAWTPFTFATTYSLLADLVTDLVVLASRWGLMGAYGRPCRFRQLSRASIVALQFWHLAGFAL